MHETIEYRGQVIKIYQDEDAESPRDWDNLGTMVCFHSRYALGDKHDLSYEDFNSWSELKQYLFKELKALIVLPLYIMDHSGIHINTTGFEYCDPGNRDSGQIGFIYVTAGIIREQYRAARITEKIRNQAKDCLLSEVNKYNDYVTGKVFWYAAETIDGNLIDSCGGYFGDTEYMINEAKGDIDYYIQEKRKAHFDKLKSQIKANVPLRYRIPFNLRLGG